MIWKHKAQSIRTIVAGSFGLALILCVSALAEQQPEYTIPWYSIDGGGGTSTDGFYTLRGTIGQHDAGYSSGDAHELLGGFWAGGALCIVEFEDFARFADYWLADGVGLPSDLDSDNDVDAEDLSWLAAYWLHYCPAGWQLKLGCAGGELSPVPGPPQASPVRPFEQAQGRLGSGHA